MPLLLPSHRETALETITMTRKRRPDIAPSVLEIVVGYVTPFVVRDASREPIAAFHTLDEARKHFPSAKVTDGALQKARELGEKSSGAP